MMTRETDTLYGASIVVDSLAAVAPFSFVEGIDPEQYARTYLHAGVTFVVFSVVADLPNSIEQSMRLLARNRNFVRNHPEQLVLADRVDVIRRAKASSQLAVGFAFQGTNALLGELSLIEIYRRLGVVQMLLAYNVANFAADGCHETRDAGLTEFGRRVVTEMNRVGMILDVTHVGLRSSLEALELTTRPAIFSHSVPKKFAAHDRNITDEQIQCCARTDGIICLNGIGPFVDRVTRTATAARVADCIEYVAQLVGPRHAAIGLDYMDSQVMARFFHSNSDIYNGGDQYPADGYMHMLSPAALPQIAEELLRRGYSATEVQGILGENYLRVLEANTLCAEGITAADTLA